MYLPKENLSEEYDEIVKELLQYNEELLKMNTHHLDARTDWIANKFKIPKELLSKEYYNGVIDGIKLLKSTTNNLMRKYTIVSNSEVEDKKGEVNDRLLQYKQEI